MTIYLLYEDASEQFVEGWQELARLIVRLIQPQTQTHLIDFEPVRGSDIKWAARPSNWFTRGRREQRKLTDFRREMARMLCEENSFVFFHFDGDCTLSDFRRGQCSNYNRYRDELLPVFSQVIGMESEFEGNEIQQRLGRLLAFVPCYSMEAWLYQNFNAVFQIFDEHLPEHPDREQFANWQSQPEQIEEVLKIKEQTALRDSYNRELILQRFPAFEIHQRETSFYDSVQRAADSEVFVEALEFAATYNPWGP